RARTSFCQLETVQTPAFSSSGTRPSAAPRDHLGTEIGRRASMPPRAVLAKSGKRVSRVPAVPSQPPEPQTRPARRAIDRELARIEAHLRRVEERLAPALALVAPDWIESARNLVHYVALRQLELRELQLLLQEHGLSSLGRSESFVMASLLEVRLRVLEALRARGEAGAPELAQIAERRRRALSWQMGEFFLHGHTHAAFGPKHLPDAPGLDARGDRGAAAPRALSRTLRIIPRGDGRAWVSYLA